MAETKADVDVKKIVENAMINLVIEFPVYANLITRIGFRIVESPRDVMAWTTGGEIQINATAIRKANQDPIVTEGGKTYNYLITQKEMQFIICHELMHIITMSWDRDKYLGLCPTDRSPEMLRKYELSNQAQDYEINSLLHNNETTDPVYGDRKRNPVGNMPDWALYDSEYKDLNAEEIFKRLVEKEKKENNGNLKQPEGDGTPYFVPGKVGKGGGMSLDAHYPIQDDDVKNEVLSKMSEVFGSLGNGQSGESGIDRAVERTFKPVPFNWRKALTKYIRSYIKANYTWNKPSRAGIANNIILPSAGTTPCLNIGVAIDTSGSISDKEINAMMDHIFTILQQFKSFEVDVWCCGSVVYPETLRTYTQNNKRSLKDFPVKSDGGNDMRENFKFIKDHYKGKKKLDMLIILSDFIDPLDGDTETTSICPCVFLCIDHKNFKKPTKIKGEVYPFKVESGWKE